MSTLGLYARRPWTDRGPVWSALLAVFGLRSTGGTDAARPAAG